MLTFGSVGFGAQGAPAMAQPNDPASPPGHGSEDAALVDLLLAGTARPIPGRTKEEGARIVMGALRQASDGQLVLHPLGQQSEWLHRRFLSSQLDIGLATWKYFKRTYFDHIELDDSQQWVRLRPSAVGG